MICSVLYELNGGRILAFIAYHSISVLVAQTVKNLPAAQTWGQSLGWEDPLQKAMTIQPNIPS